MTVTLFSFALLNPLLLNIVSIGSTLPSEFSAKVYPFTSFFGKGKTSSFGTLAQEFGIYGLARNSAGWQDKKQSKVYSMSKELKICKSWLTCKVPCIYSVKLSV